MTRTHHRVVTAGLMLGLCMMALLALPLMALAGSPTISLAAPVDSSTGSDSYPRDVAFGDLDNDGDLDMVATDTDHDQLIVRLGLGNGTFGFGATYATEALGNPSAVVIADLNRDGNLDVAASNSDTDNISVLLGDGAGALGTATQVSVGDNPTSIATGDLDNDGNLDLVATNANDNTVSVLINDGSGGFATQITYGAGGYPQRVDVADLDNDGWLDLVVTSGDDDAVRVLLNDGDGTFAGAALYSVGASTRPADVVAADLDGDGWPDLATANSDGNNVTILINDGDGTFTLDNAYAAGIGPVSLIAADLNGDGLLDLAVTAATANDVAVLAGKGDGTFRAATFFAANDQPWGLASADVDGDGKIDLACTNHIAAGTVSVILNTTTLAQVEYGGTPITASVGVLPRLAATGDLDNDGDLDIVVTNETDNDVSVILQAADGSYATEVGYATDTGPFFLALGDLDHDGDLDLVVGNRIANTLSVLLGVGDGTFGPKADYPGGDFVYGVALGDMNQDGDLDAVLGSYIGNQVCILLGDGAGGLGTASCTNTGANTRPRDLALGDMNHDGKLDVVVALVSSNQAGVMLGDGAGALGAPAVVSTGDTPACVALGDVDGDGHLDVVTGNVSDNKVSVIPGLGTGSLGAKSDYACGEAPWGVAMGDLDRDGDLDIIATEWGTNHTLSVLANNGSGAYGNKVAYNTGIGPVNVHAADMDGNGTLDLVGLSETSAAVNIHYGSTDVFDLSINKSVTPTTAAWGDTLTYTVSITNSGDTVTSVLVTDTFPSDYVTEVVSATSGLTISNFQTGAEWAWTVEDMAPGASGIITLTGVLSDYVTLGEIFTNTAEIGCAESVTATMSVTSAVSSDCVSTFTVGNAADNGPGTLRHGLAVVCDGGTIDFDLTYPATITLTSGQLQIDKDVTIQGPGSENLAISGNDTYRVFNVAGGAVQLSDLTVRDGKVTSASGAGLLTDSSLILTDVTWRDNETDLNGGAVYAGDAVTVTRSLFVENQSLASNAGALYAVGPLVLSHTQFYSSTAFERNGAVVGQNTVDVDQCLFQGNQATSFSTGALRATLDLTIRNTQFYSNTSGWEDGAVYAQNDAVLLDSLFQGNSAGREAGAIEVSGALTVTNTDFISNTTATFAGACAVLGDVTISDSLFQGNVAQGGNGGGLFARGAVELSNTQFISNTSSAASGALHIEDEDTIIRDSLFQGNHADRAGAFFIFADVTIDNTEFLNNTAATNYGAFWSRRGATISDSLFQGNVAQTDAYGAFYTADAVVIANTDFISNTAAIRYGAFRSGDDVTVSDSLFQGNMAQTEYYGAFFASSAAVITNTDFVSNTAGWVGAFGAVGSTTISDSLIERNVALSSVGGAATYGPLVMTDTQVIGNIALSGSGGGWYAQSPSSVSGGSFQRNTATDKGGGMWVTATATLLLDGVTVQENNADNDGGGVWSNGMVAITNTDFISNTADEGGGIFAAEVHLTDCTARGNTAAGDGGAILAEGTTSVLGGSLQGNTSSTLGGGICVTNTSSLTLDGVTVRDNSAVDGGGGIYANGVTLITNCLFLDNETTNAQGMGGGLFLDSLPVGLVSGPILKPFVVSVATVENSRLQGNDSRGMGGGIATARALTISNTNIVSNTAGHGGAGLSSDTGDVTMTASTVAGNIVDGGTGGGVQLMDIAKAVLTNCTIADNQANAATGDGGGGIMVSDYASANSEVHLLHCTVAGNSSASDGGGLIALGSGSPTFVMTNTLVADNTAQGGSSPDIAGEVTSGGKNLVGDYTGSTGLGSNDIYGFPGELVLARLGVLGSYGGDTETVPLLPGSPAIDSGTSYLGPSSDQRGITRDAYRDIGAFESQQFTVTTVSGSGQSTTVNTAFADPLVAGVTSGYGEPVDGGVVTFVAPFSGASATFSPSHQAVIAGGQASVIATANNVIGSYQVGAYTLGGQAVSATSTELEGGSAVLFDLTNTISVTGEARLGVRPTTLCPGNNLYYTMVVSNTHAFLVMNNLTVTSTVPSSAWYNEGDATGASQGVYDADAGTIIWTVPSLPAGEQAVFELMLHTFRTVPEGTVITETMAWSGETLAGSTEQVVTIVDSTNCGPQQPADLTILGRVTSSDGVQTATLLAAGDPIPGATVTATTCLAGAWVDVTDAEGQFEITIPGDIAEACDEVTLVFAADRFIPAQATYTVADLRTGGVRDLMLDPWLYVWLPVMWQ